MVDPRKSQGTHLGTSWQPLWWKLHFTWYIWSPGHVPACPWTAASGESSTTPQNVGLHPLLVTISSPGLISTPMTGQNISPHQRLDVIYSGHRIDISSSGNKAFYFALEFIFNSHWKSLSHNNVLFTTRVIPSAGQIARHLTAWHQVHLVHDKNKTLHCLEITWDTLITQPEMIGLLSLSKELSELM